MYDADAADDDETSPPPTMAGASRGMRWTVGEGTARNPVEPPNFISDPGRQSAMVYGFFGGG